MSEAKPEKNDFYVYAYLDGDCPIYIGKGHGKRATQHLGPNANPNNRILKSKLTKMRECGKKVLVKILASNVTEREAFRLESFFILAVGRKVTGDGPLCNVLEGGGGTLGYRHTDEVKKRLSAAHKGKIVSEETRAKLSAAHKGKIVSEETKAKLSFANLGRKMSDEYAQNCAARLQTRSPKRGYKGVRRRGDRFLARIGHNGEQHELGTYFTAEEAACAYDNEADKIWGKGVGYRNNIGKNVVPTRVLRSNGFKQTKLGRSGFRGVWKARGKWRACIYINYKQIDLGLFETAVEAAIARNEAVDTMLGGKGVKNPIPLDALPRPVSARRELTPKRRQYADGQKTLW